MRANPLNAQQLDPAQPRSSTSGKTQTGENIQHEWSPARITTADPKERVGFEMEGSTSVSAAPPPLPNQGVSLRVDMEKLASFMSSQAASSTFIPTSCSNH